MGSTAVGHVAVIATLPVIGRLYEPADLGQLGAFLAFLGVATTATALRYDIMIVAAASEREAAALVAGVCWLTVPVSAACCVVLAALIQGSLLGFEVLSPAASLWMFPALVVTQLFFTLRYWLMRSDEFPLIAKVTVWQNVVRAAAPVALFPVSGDWTGLVAAEVIGRAAGMGRMLRARGAELRRELAATTARDVRAALAAYPDSPGAGLPSAVINAASNLLPLPLLGGAFGASAAGYFALVQRALQLPISLISRNVADVYHARLAHHARVSPTAARTLFWRTSVYLTVLGGIPSLLALAIARPALGLLMGPRWAPAGDLLIAMLPWTLAMFVVSPLSRAVVVYRGQGFKLIYDLASLAAVWIVVWWGRRAHWDLETTVWALSWSQAATYVLYFGVLIHLLYQEVPAARGSRPPSGAGF